MALWVNEQLLGMRDFEVKFYVTKNQWVDAESTNENFVQLYIAAAMLLYGVRINPDHVAKQSEREGDKTQRWTYSWQPATGDAYIPQYDRAFTLKTMSYSLPKGVVKLRVRDELKRSMEDDSRRDRFFELSSWDDVNDRWIYREVDHQ